MTDISRLQTLRYGLHTNSTTFDNTPVNLYPLQITDDASSFLPRNRTPIDRNLRSLSGRRYTHIMGAQDVADLTISTEFKGVNSNTGGAVSDWEVKTEQGYLLSSLFGAVAAATTGAAPVVDNAGHTPGSGILAVVGTTTANGQVIAFSTTAGLQIGRIESGGGTATLTLQHPYTGTPTAGGTVYRLAVYTVNDALTSHVHAFFSAEYDNFNRNYFGCAPMSMNISIPNSGALAMSSVFSPTTWQDVGEANPAYADPTAGSPIVTNGAFFRIDGAEYLLRNASITYNCGTSIRETASKTNGRLGGVCGTGDGKSFMIEGELYIGDNSGSIGELRDNAGTPTMSSLLGNDVSAGQISSAHEVMIQVGTDIGSCMYALLPTADIRASVQTSGAFPVVKFQAIGTGSLPAVFAMG